MERPAFLPLLPRSSPFLPTTSAREQHDERCACEMGVVRDVGNSHGHEQPASRRKATVLFAISSTLIYGKRDAVLVDTFMTVDQNDVLADWVRAVERT